MIITLLDIGHRDNVCVGEQKLHFINIEPIRAEGIVGIVIGFGLRNE